RAAPAADPRGCRSRAVKVVSASADHSPHRQLQRDPESRIQIFRAYGTAVLFDRFAGDGQAEAGAGGFRGEVGIEDFRQKLRGNTGAVVIDGDHYSGIDTVAGEANLTSGRGLEGVLDQVGDGAAEKTC